jgi:hypothetical protein
MESDIRFISEYRVEAPALEYQEAEVAENRDRHYRAVDEAEALDEETTEGDRFDEVADSKKSVSTDLMRINEGMKTVQILGQILRNFPGSLRREVKVEIARETIAVGLRTLKVALGGLEEANAIVGRALEQMLHDEGGVTDAIRIREKVRQFCFLLDVGLVAGVVEAIAGAVGSEHLTETYKELAAQDRSLSDRMVHLAIGLDYRRPAPLNEAAALEREVGSNVVASLVIKGMVVRFLYLFPTERAERQRVCQRLGIRIKPKMLTAPAHR